MQIPITKYEINLSVCGMFERSKLLIFFSKSSKYRFFEISILKLFVKKIISLKFSFADTLFQNLKSIVKLSSLIFLFW